MDEPVLEIADLVVARGEGGNRFELRVPSLRLHRGERLALVGTSGCGKSTLLNAIALVLEPTSVGHFMLRPEPGVRIDVAAQWAKTGNTAVFAEVRRRWMGYVLQTGGLLSFLNAGANLALPRQLLGLEPQEEVRSLAATLGLERHLGRKPANLSMGERQRVAIGRALSHRPAIVIADEPTAALDPANADQVMALFVDQARERQSTLVVASHDLERVSHFDFRRLNHQLEITGDDGSVVSTFFE